VWIKCRSHVGEHNLFDTVRGATKFVYSNLTNAEYTDATSLTAFNSDGFDLGVGTNSDTNITSRTQVAWCWDAGSSTVTNNDGSITSSVRANPSAGFSIVTFTTPSSTATNFTVGHGLGVSPGMMIFKNRGTGEWYVWHSANPSSTQDYLQLQSTSAKVSSATIWNNTAPTSSVASFGGSFWSYSLNIVGYCFAPVEGYSAFGSYTGNGSTDGPFVYTGFRPAFLMIKSSSAALDGWFMVDNRRPESNLINKFLYANTSAVEQDANVADFCSNGFKIRYNYAGTNQNAATYIYAAFAESPFQYARAR